MEKVKASKARRSRANNETVEVNSDNVFVDLGFEDSDQRLLKAKLATKIAQLIETKGWTQGQAAKRIALNQVKVLRLLRGQLSGFSVDQLLAILNRLQPHG